MWDLDGVIVNSGHHHFLAYREVLEPLGIQLAEDRYMTRLFGRRNEDILREVVGGRLDDEEITRLAEKKEEAFRRLVRGNVRALPGAEALLRRARTSGLKQCIVSSTPLANVEMILESLGVRGLLGPAQRQRPRDVRRAFPIEEGGELAEQGARQPQGEP